MIQRDGANHLFTEVENIRITYVPARDREEVDNWAGSDVLRVQAYLGSDGCRLHEGAELPVPNAEVFVELVSALCVICSVGGRATRTG